MQTELTGVQRYTKKILEGFPPDMIELVHPDAINARGMKGHLWEQFSLPFLLKNNLLFSPSITGPITVKDQILVVHDVVPLDHPEWVNKYFAKWYKFILPQACKTAKHLVAISEFTKERMLKQMNIPEEKISVIYNGVDHTTEEGETMQLPFKRYILSLGSVEPRKNLTMMLKAWEKIVDKIPEDIGLVICGKRGSSIVFSDHEFNIDFKRVHYTGYVDEKYINSLYKNAMFFVYLSFYEGFGLPPLEAMAKGCPVLTGNQSAIPEVVGDAGVMVDPYSLNEIIEGFMYYIQNDEQRLAYGHKGKQRSLKFNWDVASAKTWSTIESFL